MPVGFGVEIAPVGATADDTDVGGLAGRTSADADDKTAVGTASTVLGKGFGATVTDCADEGDPAAPRSDSPVEAVCPGHTTIAAMTTTTPTASNDTGTNHDRAGLGTETGSNEGSSLRTIVGAVLLFSWPTTLISATGTRAGSMGFGASGNFSEDDGVADVDADTPKIFPSSAIIPTAFECRCDGSTDVALTNHGSNASGKRTPYSAARALAETAAPFMISIMNG